MTKISNDKKHELKAAAKKLLTYYEPYIERKQIHKKDMLSNNMIPRDGVRSNRSYTAQFYNERIVSEETHFKRLKKAYSRNGDEGVKYYLDNFSKLQFDRLTWWDKFLRWLNKSK